MGALLVPLVRAVGDAQSAKDGLVAAEQNIAAGNLDQASSDIKDAQSLARSAQSRLNGVSGSIWSAVPVAGSAVRDLRHLADALSGTADVAGEALALKQEVTASDGALIANNNVDLAKLKPIIERASALAAPLKSATKALAEVEGTAPFVGYQIIAKRDEALKHLAPLQSTFLTAEPALKALPQILGEGGKKKYLLAILNPGELRYSGGAPLSLAEMTARDGKLKFSAPADLSGLNRKGALLNWDAVADNPLHSPGTAIRLSNSTFNPNWSISGEELLRGWKELTGTDCDGVLAIDLPGLSRLFKLSGPVDVAPYGQLSADNLVSELAGSYDDYTPEAQKRRHDLNDAIIPAFRSRFLSGGRYSEKLTALRDAGSARQFAMYFRDPSVQKAMAGIGLDGDLSKAEGDYIFVSTQNVNGSKVDFFQQRTVTASIKIGEDLSVANRVVMNLNNVTPPYAGGGEDRKFGYYTRWAGITAGIFLPNDADVIGARVNGRLVRRTNMETGGRTFFRRPMMIPPNGKRNLAYSYTLANAVRSEAGEWIYDLHLQPQSIAGPQAWTVIVTWPAGHTLDPAKSQGWKSTGATSAEFTMSGVPTNTDLRLVLSK